jgi:hypothetical protein
MINPTRTSRIEVHIKEDHSRARLEYKGQVFEVPLCNWSVNGGMQLTIPWEWVNLHLHHPEPEEDQLNGFSVWRSPNVQFYDPETNEPLIP